MQSRNSKLFNFRSGSTFFLFMYFAPAPNRFPVMYFHFKMYYSSNNISNTGTLVSVVVENSRIEFLFILAASNLTLVLSIPPALAPAPQHWVRPSVAVPSLYGSAHAPGDIPAHCRSRHLLRRIRSIVVSAVAEPVRFRSALALGVKVVYRMCFLQICISLKTSSKYWQCFSA